MNYNLHNISCQFNNHVDVIEMTDYLRLFFLLGVFKSNNEDIESLFAPDETGPDIFRATMSLKRFDFLTCSLRLGNKQPERIKQSNKNAASSFS